VEINSVDYIYAGSRYHGGNILLNK
jgi:hypothetical protein